MGTRELFLVLGAIVLFSIVSLSVHKALFDSKDHAWMNEFEIGAIAVAQQFIEEAKVKMFDEVLIGSTPTGLPYTFTATGTLGPESGEIYPNFDDVDDFNGFIDTVRTSRNEFIVQIAVGYVSDTTPNVISAGQTFYKKMRVNIQNPFFYADTIKSDFIFAYWGQVP